MMYGKGWTMILRVCTNDTNTTQHPGIERMSIEYRYRRGVTSEVFLELVQHPDDDLTRNLLLV